MLAHTHIHIHPNAYPPHTYTHTYVDAYPHTQVYPRGFVSKRASILVGLVSIIPYILLGLVTEYFPLYNGIRILTPTLLPNGSRIHTLYCRQKGFVSIPSVANQCGCVSLVSTDLIGIRNRIVGGNIRGCVTDILPTYKGMRDRSVGA